MKTRSLLFFIFGLLLVIPSSTLIFRGAAAANSYTNITVIDAKTMIDSDLSLVLLDVRNQSEYVAGHIRNARIIPLFQIDSSIGELDQTDKILVYCETGWRSETASQILVSNGFLRVFNMLGGIADWISEEYPVYVQHSSIQEVVNNATDGAKIYVSSGLYAEHLTLNKSVTLIGENRYTSILDGTSNGTVVYVDADNVSLSDFKIQYSGCACAGYCGINIESHHQNINITNNEVFSNGFGIRMNKTRNITVVNNNLTHLTDSVLTVVDSSDVVFAENNIADNMDGIELDNVTHSVFTSNNISSSVNGITMVYSDNNTFSGNTIASNIFYGFEISRSDNNSMLHNSFLGNGIQASTHESTNTWDDGFEGNYWTDYAGKDANSDGIGDIPHILDADNHDNHPLMGTFHSHSTSINEHVNIITNSTIDGFEYFGPNSTIRLTVSNTTADQTYGFCRINIPHDIIDPNNGPITVVIDNGQTPVIFLNTTIQDNGTNRWIYFAYSHSTHEIIVVPELQLTLLPALFIATLLIAVVCRKRLIRTR